MTYDKNNIIAKITRGEIPARKIYEDDTILAVHDINPVAPIHILVFPKAEYTNFDDFVKRAQEKEISNYFIKINDIAQKLEVTKGSYRIVSNIGARSGQTIFHFHTHIISGREITELAG
ncbi:MAG: HIT domain-containing protein [Janthinobacterium lividum]